MNEIVSIRLSFLKSVTFVTFWRYHNEFNHLDGNAKVTATPEALLLLPFWGLTDKNGRNVNKPRAKMAHAKSFKKGVKSFDNQINSCDKRSSATTNSSSTTTPPHTTRRSYAPTATR